MANAGAILLVHFHACQAGKRDNTTQQQQLTFLPEQRLLTAHLVHFGWEAGSAKSESSLTRDADIDNNKLSAIFFIRTTFLCVFCIHAPLSHTVIGSQRCCGCRWDNLEPLIRHQRWFEAEWGRIWFLPSLLMEAGVKNDEGKLHLPLTSESHHWLPSCHWALRMSD